MFEFNATFIIAMASFIVFIIIMNSILYKPILSIIEKRQSYIDDNNNAAIDSRNKTKSILADKEKRLSDTAYKSREIISARVQQENENSLNIEEKAKAESLADINSAKDSLKNDAANTTEILKNNIKDLAENISSKILGENIAINNVDYEFIDKVLK